MKLCVSYIYWMLLFTSVVSSTLLFLIVASENIQNNNVIGPDKNEAFVQERNNMFIEDSEYRSEADSEEGSNNKISSSLKSKVDEQHFEDVEASISTSFGISNNEENKFPKDIKILKESLTQQPNLSQGISDGEQLVVLTLVKSSSNLQSLTTESGEYRSKPVLDEGNASTGLTPDDENLEQPHNLVGLSELLEGNDSASNETDETDYYEESDENVVVVVRAEQKSHSSIGVESDLEREDEKERDNVEEPRHVEEVEEDSPSQQKSPTTAPDLNDGVTRTRLAGSVDDSAAVIPDSFVTAGPSETHEEIPSFNEWAQKRLEEVEKKKAHPNASVQTANGSSSRNLGNMRMRSKNYASPDCGAKIVAANPESRSARSILVSTRDEYMLNTCTIRVWFIVELCEAIQAKKIELANFELFSSSPKDLSVYVSDRFPTRDWSIVGQFTARDERDVQSFSLQPHLFGKFIKVELHSHYGSEHFCPISLFRAYGTSEFEVLETETETDLHDDNQRHESSTGGKIDTGADAENEDDDDEDILFEDEEDSTSDRHSHIFGSARDAVISIVKKAAEALVKNDDLKSIANMTDIQKNRDSDALNDASINDCITPIYNVICRDCDDNRFSRVFQLISCKARYLKSLLNTNFIRQILDKNHLCDNIFEFNLFQISESCTDSCKALNERNKNIFTYDKQAQFFSSFFGSNYIIALCNILAAKENRLFMNTTHHEQQNSDRIPNETRIEQNRQTILTTKEERFMSTRPIDVIPTSGHDKTKVEIPVIKSKMEIATESQLIENFAPQIKPTKTTAMNDEVKKPSFVSNLESSRSQQSEDYEVYQVDNSITTDSSIPVVTKRTSIHSQKASSGTQEQVQCSQEESLQQEVPILGVVSKLSQNLDSTQKLNPKSVNIENGDVETETEEEAETKTKMDSTEQDSKIVQDQLNFEGFDFKDLDVESLQNNGGIKNDVSVTQQTASATTPQQKESVFLRLSNRIKALERNMSLSSQYLEELSRRYKKQVEEMQRSLERAMTTMSEETRKGEERENKRLEEVTALEKQINKLSKIVDTLVHERNSWRISFSSIMQHAIFVFVDVVLVILILFYCRRVDDDLDYIEEENNRRIVVKRARGTNYEIAKQQCTQMTKKPKKRRPSEIASQVSGTYDQLMIEDSISINQPSKRDRRKKRKKDSVILRTSSIKEAKNIGKGDGNSQDVITGLSLLPSRSSSTNDALYTISQTDDNTYIVKESHKQGRPGSAPDNSINYFSNSLQQAQYERKVQILSKETNHTQSINSSENVALNSEVLDTSAMFEDDAFVQAESSAKSINVKPKKLSSPSFIKTALASRSKRITFSGSSKKKQSQYLEENLVKPIVKGYDAKNNLLSELENSNGLANERRNGHTTNGHIEESDESRSSSATPTVNWSKKEKKSNGIKKMNQQGTY